MDKNVPGSRIKKLRLEKNITQLKLSKYLNISNTTLSQYEVGTRRPDYETLKKIAEYFNVSTDYLLGISDGASRASIPKADEKNCYTFDLTGLPEEVVEQVSEYIESVKQKYSDTENKKETESKNRK